jgi:hypothetical protein
VFCAFKRIDGRTIHLDDRRGRDARPDPWSSWWRATLKLLLWEFGWRCLSAGFACFDWDHLWPCLARSSPRQTEADALGFGRLNLG